MRVVLLITFFISVIILNINAVYAASWYYPDWTYRQVILINNSIPTPEDYQVKIIFDSSDIDYSKTNDDGYDLRFTYYDPVAEEEEAVNYWIEYWNESGESVVWIKTPKMDGIYYVYYGNGEASAESNIHTTFIFGDDFEDGIIDSFLWKAGGPGFLGTWIEDNGVLSQTSTTQGLKSMLVNLSESSWIVSVKMRPDSWGDDYRGGLAGRETIGEGYSGNYSNEYIGFYGHIFTISYSDKSKIRWLKEHYESLSEAWGPEVDPGFTFSIGTWYNIETAFINSTSMKGKCWDVAKTVPEWQVLNNDMNPLTNKNTGMYGGYTSTFSFDDFRVRKYSSQEPNYTIGKIEYRGPPELISTEIENMYEGLMIHDVLREFFTKRYVDVMLTAWISSDDVAESVRSNFSAEAGILVPETVPMERTGEGEYSSSYGVVSVLEIVQYLVGFLVSYLTSGTEITSPGFQPEVTWEYVTVNSTWGDSYPYAVGEKLPSVLDSLPSKFTGRATMFMAACPVDILVIDPEGRRTGSLYENGEFVGLVNEINKSAYTGRETEPEFVVVFDPMEGKYEIRIYGNGTGYYNFSIISVDNGSVLYWMNYTNVSIGEGEVHVYHEQVTDIKPPEAVIGYDPASGKLIIEGGDNFDKNVSVTYEEWCSRSLFKRCMESGRNYTLTDDAGNRLVLSMEYNEMNHSYRYGGFFFTSMRLLGARYEGREGSQEIEYDRNWLSFNTQQQFGDIKHFSEHVYVKGREFLRVLYESGRNETFVINRFGDEPGKEVMEGMHVLKMITDREDMIKILG